MDPINVTFFYAAESIGLSTKGLPVEVTSDAFEGQVIAGKVGGLRGAGRSSDTYD
jgi:hypothetical protein